MSALALALAPLILFAWTGPTAAPTGNNVAAPINVGNVDQVKNGGLGLNSLAVFGNSLLGGSTGSNAYLNFGPTSGTNGYGIRDKDGTLEFKNSGGSWASLQSTIFTLCGGGACGGGGGPWTTSGNNISNTNTGNVGIGTPNPQSALQVGGTMIIGNGGETCQAATEGAQRYNSTIKRMQYCNGSAWQTIGACALGATVQKATNTIYQAATDGYVSFYVGTTATSWATACIASSAGAVLPCYGSDGTNPAIISRAADWNAGAFPVQTGKYWSVEHTSDGTTSVYWTPLVCS